jgi:ABC-type multidrug transport system fused ATPase/permease subunit
VLEDGEVREQGTHDELMAKNGVYKRLVDVQNIRS